LYHIESEDLFPCLQEPDESSFYPPILYIQLHFNIIPSTPRSSWLCHSFKFPSET